jgi:PII-like signaling protein
MVVTTGVLLRLFVHEGQRHQGEVLYDWLRRARVMGITGGAAYREIAGYGCPDKLHEQSFFELAGELPVEVAFAMAESDAQKFREMLAT